MMKFSFRITMGIMEQYYKEHQLIINLKKEKIESVQFGISERSSSHERDRTIARLVGLEVTLPLKLHL